MPQAKKAPHPSRRSQRAYRAILEATGQLVARQGIAATSIDQVADRAGVGKQTIYRWWPNKAALVLEYARHAARPVAEPDTGDVRGDLRKLAEDLCRTLGESPAGRICAELVSSAEADPEFGRAFRETFVSERRATVVSVLERGQERGQVRSDIDLQVATDMLYGPIWYRRLVGNEPLTTAFGRRLADAVADAVASH